jgi:hypothetical protein
MEKVTRRVIYNILYQSRYYQFHIPDNGRTAE